MAQIQIDKLEKRYREVRALKAVSTEIPDGSLTAILGPSGCGKTTLLRCIAGLLLPDEGTIKIGDKDVTWLEPYHRQLGMVFQRPSMFPHLTVYQNIAWALELRHWTKGEIPERVREMLRLVRLKGYEHRRFSELSGGQAQRVVIARALAPKPALLLLDEPLSALDAKLREELTHEIADIHHQTGCTILLVTHDQAEAMTIADNVLLMNEGEIVQSGSPLELYRHPKTLFSANFIGMNSLLPCVVLDNEGPTCVRLENTPVTFQTPEARPDFNPGTPVWLCVRADDIDVVETETNDHINLVSVRVKRVSLTGSTIHVEASFHDYSLRINVGGSKRLELLDAVGQEITCRLSHIAVLARG
jgi:ABC-type Fe3+/spermidine/putrescine transport system ATPase subunit